MNNTPRILSAIEFSKAHPSLTNEDDYAGHRERVAEILSQLNMDEDTVIAGLLHDGGYDAAQKEQISSLFGNSVLNLLDETAKISRLTMKCDSHQRTESVRKMIFALIDDIRVIMIKLADKLDRMRNLKGVDSEKQKKTVQEAIGIWAPIANRLGISSIKDELEDLSLKYSNPEVFAQIKSIVAQKKDERSVYLQKAVDEITANAAQAGINVSVYARAKHFYSIYQKMRKRNKGPDEIYDLLAMRILCRNTVECYTIIGIVHTLWKPVDGRFKDYIAKPKPNGYQSLHTTVMCAGRPLEIQIRTYAMHETAENGVASHWLYKKGTNRDSVTEKNLPVVNQMKELGKDLVSGTENEQARNEFFKKIKEELLGTSVFVFTPKGDVIELPAGACAIDFAYAVHSSVGQKISAAKADGVIIPLSMPLKNTQVIEIITSQSARPTVNQLEQVKTSKARAKIRSWLAENGSAFVKTNKPESAEDTRLNSSNVHHGQTKEQYLRSLNNGELPETVPHIIPRIRIGDTSNFMVSFARCCKPVYGDSVVGYVSRGRGIIVHKENCPNVWRIQNIEQRMAHVEWMEKDDPANPKSKN